MTDVLDRVVLLADDLANERMRTARQNEVMLLAEESLELIKRLRDRLVIARRQLRSLDQDSVEASLGDEDLFRWTFDAKLSCEEVETLQSSPHITLGG